MNEVGSSYKSEVSSRNAVGDNQDDGAVIQQNNAGEHAMIQELAPGLSKNVAADAAFEHVSSKENLKQVL